MNFINTAYAAFRTVLAAIFGIIPTLLRDVGTIGAVLSPRGPNRPDQRATMAAAARLAAAVVVVVMVYPAARNVYIMEFIDNPRIAAANALKIETEATAMAFRPGVADYAGATERAKKRLLPVEVHGAADGGSCDANLLPLPKGTQTATPIARGEGLPGPPCVSLNP